MIFEVGSRETTLTLLINVKKLLKMYRQGVGEHRKLSKICQLGETVVLDG